MSDFWTWVVVCLTALVVVLCVMVRNLVVELEYSDNNLYAWEEWYEDWMEECRNAVVGKTSEEVFFEKWEEKNREGVKFRW